MKNLLIYSLLLIGICFSFSCQKQKDPRQVALELAKENRAELENVLEHYKEDSLKYKAACFLIENMPYHFYYKGEELNKYYKYFSTTKGRSSEVFLIRDSLAKADGEFKYHYLDKEMDIEIISASYLIQNIDWAFKVWREQPWGSSVNFNDFCEYILPYRVGDEIPTVWREELYHTYNSKLDSIRSLPEATDPAFVAKFLHQLLASEPNSYTTSLPNGPHLGFKNIEFRTGSCREFSDVILYVFRALGVPCGVDYMARGDNNANHFWNFVISETDSLFTFELLDINNFGPATNITNPKGKVFRKTYSINRHLLKDINKPASKIHPLFRFPLFFDVTKSYADKWCRNVELSKDVLYTQIPANEVLYLCMSNLMDWKPVDYTVYKGGKVFVPHVEGNIVARLGIWDGEKLQMCSDPFLIEKETPGIKFFNPENQNDTIKVLYKFHLYDEPYTHRMVGGVFEGSNCPRFTSVDTIYQIQERPLRLFNTAFSTTNKKYRYVRYYGSPGSHCNIAEVIFYGKENDTLPLTGKIIGTYGCWQKDESNEYWNVFDGDPYTSFDYQNKDGGWSGLDLGKPYAIGKIQYVPRNNDNFIRAGDTYELFYWQNRQWNSTGYVKATSDSITYIVPKGSLLYLRNHTRGKEERIFEYINNQQKFW